MEKSRFSGSSLPCGIKSNPAMQTRADGDHVMNSKSQTTTNLKDAVCPKEDILNKKENLSKSQTTTNLKDARCPKEDILNKKENLSKSQTTTYLKDAVCPKEDILNKKENKAMKQESGCAKPTRKCPFEAYLEKCTRLERENLEVKKKLEKMEKYSIECKTELQIFVKRFKEFKSINKDLDTKNKQLLIKNQQMRQRITEILKQNRPKSEDLERVPCCEHQEKQQLRETIVVPQERVKNSSEPVRKSLKDSEITEERKILTLQKENQTLRERLNHSIQVIKDAESRAERAQEELYELECCLLTVQTERNLLRQELNRLHKEYISLTNCISVQLKENNKAVGLRGLTGKP